MNRTVAIVLTVATAICSGLPGLGLICLGSFAALGTQMPDVMAQNNTNPQDAIVGSIVFLCLGFIMVIIPLVVGIVTFRLSQRDEMAINESYPPNY